MSEPVFITLTPETLAKEHLCCIIRSRKPHPGVEAKRQWLAERLKEGHVFRKLDVKGCAFIEYAPLETAWVPIVGENYLYIYCLWVTGALKGCGYGRALMESCLADARARGRSGVCMLGAQTQKAWLSDQSFAGKFGFETVDTTPGGYTLLALSFDGSRPAFSPNAKRETIENRGLTVYYSLQCPYIPQRVETLRAYCAEREIPASFVPVDSLEKAKALPCPFNNWAVFYEGRFQTVNQIDGPALERILKRGKAHGDQQGISGIYAGSALRAGRRNGSQRCRFLLLFLSGHHSGIHLEPHGSRRGQAGGSDEHRF